MYHKESVSLVGRIFHTWTRFHYADEREVLHKHVGIFPSQKAILPSNPGNNKFVLATMFGCHIYADSFYVVKYSIRNGIKRLSIKGIGGATRGSGSACSQQTTFTGENVKLINTVVSW